MTALTLSPQQAAAIEWVRSGTGSARVEAVPGAGKTTLLEHAISATEGTVAFCAFNKKIVTEIEGRVARRQDPKSPTYDPAFVGIGNRLKIGTFHSFGFGTVRRTYPTTKLDARAKQDACEMALRIPRELSSFVPKLVGLAKQAAIGLYGSIDDDSLWYGIVDHHDLSEELDNPADLPRAVDYAKRALSWHGENADKYIDFDDMIYLPVVSGAKMWQQDWILVDEDQDTNPARRALARKMLKPGGRALFVGDTHQAIYGFTGADADAVEQIVRDFKAIVLPLTVSFRCPVRVVAEAQTVVPHITAAPGAPEGVVETLQSIVDTPPVPALGPSDAVLCRLTKPLVSLAYQLIRRGVACHVEGKEIGTGLLKLVDRWKVNLLSTLRDRLEAYLDRETEKLVAKGRETAAEALADRVETINVLCDGCDSVQCLRDKITKMFVDGDKETKPTLTLSTVHKAKGREWDRVFLLGRSEYMPSKWARQDWQVQQEMNLIYVAVTRAKSELYYVPAPAEAPHPPRGAK